MANPDHDEPTAEAPPARRPYAPPAVETDRVIEKQLLVICSSVDEGCQQEPPQS